MTDMRMPRRDSISRILEVFTGTDLQEFVRELYDSAIIALENRNAAGLEPLRRTLVDWEYTAVIKSHPEYADHLAETRKAIADDPKPGVDWREFCRR